MSSGAIRLAKAIARRIPGGMGAARHLRRLIDPQLRAVERLRASGDPLLLQPWPTTADDRYPELFDTLAQHLTGNPHPRILSFGCSTGEEVRAIKARLPEAAVTGIDINSHAVALAQRRDPQGDYRTAAAPPPGARYDAILALAVFRHGEIEAQQPQDCSAIMPFAKFASGLAALDNALEQGGLLALWNSHFRFGDLPWAERYEVCTLDMDEPPLDLLYGADNQRREGVTETAALFRKLTA